MHYLSWMIKLLVFVVLFGFAMHNAAPIDLHFFLGYAWNAPLAMILLVFFVIGAAFGILASFGQVIRLRRELVQLRKVSRTQTPAPQSQADQILEQPKDAI
ncbi:LapA family protein [Chitinibacter bivalviorum]|uniref:LapA family protein n=1 Tax=Chitinibacter bivalviorum TaxID=2739434 RepID=A0A7H9BIC5_9NEIS|nr:LapA family protein [Chitinibacter bivalviorum]QLG87701.1 LapA family protein [Chitinibacter bivalviorum]